MNVSRKFLSNLILAIFLFAVAISPRHGWAAAAAEDMAVIQQVHAAVEDAVREIPGVEVIMQGSHVTLRNFKNPLTGGSSDFDMRVVIRDNLASEADYLERWRTVRDKMRSALSRRFPDGKQLDIIEKSVNLYLPEQIMTKVSDRAEAMALYRRLNVVPSLAYESAQGLDDETLKKAAGGLYGDEAAQATRQAFERKYGVTIGRDPATGQVRRYGTTDLSHLSEGKGVYTAKSAGNAASQWIDDALAALRNNDIKGTAKNTARAKILLKGKDLIRAPLQENDRNLLAAADEMERILGTYGDKVMDESATAAFKQEVVAVTEKYTLQEVLRNARIDAEALKFAQSARVAESVVSKGLLSRSGRWALIADDFALVVRSTPGGILPTLLAGLFTTFESATIGQTSVEEGYDKAMKTLGIDVVSLFSGPIGWGQLATQISVKLAEIATDSVKEKVYQFAAGSQNCSDLIAGVYTVRGRETQNEQDRKCPEIKSYEQLACITDKRETVVTLAECHSANAAKRFSKGGAGENQTEEGIVAALRNKCVIEAGQDKAILLEWAAARDSLAAQVQEIVGAIEAMPLQLTISPGTITVKPGIKTILRVTASPPNELPAALEKLKSSLQCLGAKGSTPAVHLRYKWILNGTQVAEDSRPAAEISLEHAGYQHIGVVMTVEYGSSNYNALNAYLKTIITEAYLPINVAAETGGAAGTGSVSTSTPAATNAATPPSSTAANQTPPVKTDVVKPPDSPSGGTPATAPTTALAGADWKTLSPATKEKISYCICNPLSSTLENKIKETLGLEIGENRYLYNPAVVSAPGGSFGGRRPDSFHVSTPYYQPDDGLCYIDVMRQGTIVERRFSMPPAPDALKTCTDKFGEIAPKTTEKLEVVIEVDRTEIAVGESLNLTAKATGGKPDYTFVWGGDAKGSGPTAQFSAAQPGKYSLAITTTDAAGNKAGQTLTITVGKLTVKLTKLSPVENSVQLGSKAEFNASIQLDGKDVKGPFVIRWQPHPEVTFHPFEHSGVSASTAAVFQRIGDTKVWAVALINKNNVLTTVGESEPISVTVIAPELSLRLSNPQPLVGAEVKATVNVPAGVDSKEIDFRWDLGKAVKVSESQDKREVTFYLKDTSPETIRVSGVVRGKGDSLGPEKSAPITASFYELKMDAPRAMGPKPRKYDPIRKEFVDVEGGFTVFQDIELGVTVTPEPEKGPLRYQWASANTDCSLSAPVSRQTRLNCQRTGSYPIGVSVYDSRGIELGRTMIEVPVVIDQTQNPAKESSASLPSANQNLPQSTAVVSTSGASALKVQLKKAVNELRPGQTTEIFALVSGGKNPITYSWQGPAAGAGDTVRFKADAPGTYSVVVEVADADQNKATATLAIEVKATVADKATPAATPATTSQGLNCAAEVSRGGTEYAGQNYQGALEAWNRALAICNDKCILYNNMGNAKMRMNDPQAAKQYFVAALACDPGNAFFKDNMEKAESVLAKQRQQQTQQQTQQLCTQEFNRGMTAFNAQDFRGAIAAWESSLQYCSDRCMIYNNLGIAKQHQQDWNGAKDYYTAAVNCRPDNAQYRQNLSAVTTYLEQKQQQQQTQQQPQRLPQLEYNTNRYGSDYKAEYPVDTPEQCRLLCVNDSNCRAFTWVKAGVQAPAAKCWLKHSVPEPNGDGNCVSGVK